METLGNPFEILSQKLDLLLLRMADLEKKATAPAPSRIPLKQFCREYDISRVSAYSWAQRGLIELEKVAGRQFVKVGSVKVVKKFQREPIAA